MSDDHVGQLTRRIRRLYMLMLCSVLGWKGESAISLRDRAVRLRLRLTTALRFTASGTGWKGTRWKAEGSQDAERDGGRQRETHTHAPCTMLLRSATMRLVIPPAASSAVRGDPIPGGGRPSWRGLRRRSGLPLFRHISSYVGRRTVRVIQREEECVETARDKLRQREGEEDA